MLSLGTKEVKKNSKFGRNQITTEKENKIQRKAYIKSQLITMCQAFGQENKNKKTKNSFSSADLKPSS